MTPMTTLTLHYEKQRSTRDTYHIANKSRASWCGAQGDLFPAETINSRLSLERYEVIFEWLRVVGF
jgi:hypothetical protein